MTKHLNGFVLWYHGSHIVFYMPEWFGFIVYDWLHSAIYVSADATPDEAWLYIGACQHGVHLTALRRGQAVVWVGLIVLLAVAAFIIGGR